MNVDEFLDWAVGRPGRHELFRGEVIAMSPETVGHAASQGCCLRGLAVEHPLHAALPGHVLPDGRDRADRRRRVASAPCAQVYSGEKLKSSAVEVRASLNWWSSKSCRNRRRRGRYGRSARGLAFACRACRAALIVDPTQPSIVDHARGEGEAIATRIVTEGRIVLDPAGISRPRSVGCLRTAR